MSLVEKIKRVALSNYYNLTSKNLNLKDGTYFTEFDVIHYTERCGWKKFGTKNETDYEHWWKEACGIVSLYTVTNAVKSKQKQKQPVFFEQIQQAIKDGAYHQYEKNGQTVSVGWKHNGLVDLAKKQNIRGYAASLSLASLCQSIIDNKLVIASIYRPFSRFIDENAPTKKRGGHLVVIKGFIWENGRCRGFFVDDPYDIKERVEPIPAQLFEEVYSGAAIAFYAPSVPLK